MCDFQGLVGFSWSDRSKKLQTIYIHINLKSNWLRTIILTIQEISKWIGNCRLHHTLHLPVVVKTDGRLYKASELCAKGSPGRFISESAAFGMMDEKSMASTDMLFCVDQRCQKIKRLDISNMVAYMFFVRDFFLLQLERSPTES